MSRAGECSGAYDCTATRHVHGCYADIEGRCDAPEEHVRRAVAAHEEATRG